SRPCKRCVSVGKDDTCRDVEHKKRGRPKLVDKAIALENAAWPAGKGGAITTKSSAAPGALTKTRVKGKYTKSANYKLPKKAVIGAKTIPSTGELAFVAPQITAPLKESMTVNQSDRQSSHPSHQEHERLSSSMSYSSHPSSVPNYQSRPVSIHAEPTLPEDRQDPFYYSSSYPSSTGQVKRPQEIYSAPSTAPLVTIFLTMDLICARVSDESQVLWGYHPHNISHTSLYSIVANEHQRKMRDLVDKIKDAVFAAAPPSAPRHLSHYPFLESSSPVFYQNRPGIMSSSAPGSSEYTDVVRICHAEGGSDLFSVRLFVGGGLGTDLIRGTNIEHAYIVCIMARHSPPTLNNHSCSVEHQSLNITQSTSYDSVPISKTPVSQQRFPPLDQPKGQDVARNISLPPIFTSPSSMNSSSLSSPSGSSPMSPISTNSRHSKASGSFNAPMSSTSYTVPLSKPSSHSSSLPALRTGPLHTARWLYDPEPFGSSAHAGHSAPSQRLPTMFADPFRAISAPMGGFGVSKYLNRSEPAPAFSNVRRHQLPLPSPLQSSQGSRSDSATRTPRSLQRDLSSSSFGASFASRSPPLSMKRPLADMADIQDRNRDIDNRHQDHHQHQNTPSSSLPSLSRPPYQSNIKLELQSMPPDHPAIDPSGPGVCPIVHGSQQIERVQQAQLQASLAAREMELKENHGRVVDTSSSLCRWAKMSDQWRGVRSNGSTGHDRFALTPTQERERQHERGQDEYKASGDYFNHEGSCPVGPQSVSPIGQQYSTEGPSYHSSNHGEDKCRRGGSSNSDNQNGLGHHSHVNPFSTGPSSPNETYSHHKSVSSLRRTSSVGRPLLTSRSKGSVVCLSGACGSICRCSGEDEETRAVKAMDAARKRMSVHSLLC
ncbi:hypothetical protein BGZ51_007143, partial [Haplosporangium sp. Z 767]